MHHTLAKPAPLFPRGSASFAAAAAIAQMTMMRLRPSVPFHASRTRPIGVAHATSNASIGDDPTTRTRREWVTAGPAFSRT